jgi:hypothetical protein
MAGMVQWHVFLDVLTAVRFLENSVWTIQH